MQVKHVEAGHAVFVDVAARAFHVLVAAGAERFVSGSGEHHYTYVVAFAADTDRIEHFRVGLGPERVVDSWTVDCYLCYSFELLKKNVGVFFDGFPGYHYRIRVICV